MEQIVYNNPDENVNPITNNEMVLPNNQQVPLRDALEVVPYLMEVTFHYHILLKDLMRQRQCCQHPQLKKI